jgi:hypothetical protein
MFLSLVSNKKINQNPKSGVSTDNVMTTWKEHGIIMNIGSSTTLRF